MKESTKTGVGITLGMCFVIGLLLFLAEARSTGEAPERFNLIVSLSTVSIVGMTLAVGALAVLVVLYLPELKKGLKHK